MHFDNDEKTICIMEYHVQVEIERWIHYQQLDGSNRWFFLSSITFPFMDARKSRYRVIL